MPEVVIVIPTYNRAGYLPAAIESVLRQGCADMELMVVDDGSTDNTAEVVARYGKAVRYARQENRGCASARNLGVRLADSRYIAFLDSDDLFAPGKLTVQRSILDAKPLAGFVYSDSIEFRILGGRVHYFLLPAVARSTPHSFAIKHFLQLGVRPGSLLVRRKAYETVGGFDETMRYNEDSDFIQRLSIGHEALFSGYPSILQRQHAANKSSRRLEIYRALLYSMERTLERYPEFRQALPERKVERRLSEIRITIESLEENVVESPGQSQQRSSRMALNQKLTGYRRKFANLAFRQKQLLHMRRSVRAVEDLLLADESVS